MDIVAQTNGEVGCLFRLLFLNDYIPKGHYRPGRTCLSLWSTQRHASQATREDCSHSHTVSQLIIHMPPAHPTKTHAKLPVSQRTDPLFLNQKESTKKKKGLTYAAFHVKKEKLYGTFLKLANIPWEVKQGNQMSLRDICLYQICYKWTRELRAHEVHFHRDPLS